MRIRNMALRGSYSKMNSRSLFLLTALSLSCGDVSALEICTDHSPAAVANVLRINIEEKPRHRNDRPNIVVILVDDMGHGDLSIYAGDIPTPNIDRLAEEGARFTDGYSASPLCSPSRGGLMTGKQPASIKHFYNFVDQFKHGLSLAEKTMADYFKEIGYVTGIVGKWHLGSSDKHTPDNRGFDEYFYDRHQNVHHNVHHIPGKFHHYQSESYVSRFEHNLNPSILSIMGPCDRENKYLTDMEGLEASAFILRNRNRPFFLYLSTAAPHAPHYPRQESLMKRLSYYRIPGYARKIFDRPQRQYYRMLIQLDEAIGRVVETIDQSGLSENTLIWFLSDNGGWTWGDNLAASDSGALKGKKGTLYEGGIRVPFIARWTGVIPPAIHEWPIISLDILPTSLAAAKGSPEISEFSHLHGVNMLPYLREKSPPPDRDLYWRIRYTPDRSRSITKPDNIYMTRSAIRSGQWKLISHTIQGKALKHELYDLQNDIAERNNLLMHSNIYLIYSFVKRKHLKTFLRLQKKLESETSLLPN